MLRNRIERDSGALFLKRKMRGTIENQRKASILKVEYKIALMYYGNMDN